MIYKIIICLAVSFSLNSQKLMDEVELLVKEGEYSAAISLLESEFENQDTLGKLVFQDKLATFHGLNQNYEEAFKLKEIAIHGFKAIGNDTLTSIALYGLSKFFNDRYEYDTSFKYQKEAMTYARTKIDSAKIISNLGVSYKHLNKFDSARIFYLRGLELYPEDGDLEFYTITYNNLALLEKRVGNKQKALKYYEKAEKFHQQNGDLVGAASIAVNKTYVYYDLEEYEKAEKVLIAQEEIVMSKGTTVEKLNFDLIRYNIAEKLGKSSETLKYYQSYRKTKDSVDNLKLNTQIAEFEVKYETAEKERQLAVTENQLVKTKLGSQYLRMGLIGTIWLGLFGTLFYWSRNRYQKKLNKEKMHNLAIESMLNGQENERMRIAADLHDSIGGLLTTIKLHFEDIQHKITDWATKNKTDNLNDLLDKASLEVRRISHNMAPRALNLSGLNAALGDLSTEINATGKIEVNYEWHGEEINEQDQIMVYRIVQEASNNALKHAKASLLFIQINVFEDGYSVLVEDDGKGFKDESESEGMGLRNIRSRASILNAKINIDSVISKGTSILLTKGLA